MVLPRNLRIARRHPCRNDDPVVLARQQLLRIHARAQAQRHAGGLYAAREVAHHLVKLFLARNRLGHVQLAADFRCGIEQVHRMAALRQRDRCRQARRPRTHHRKAALRGRLADDQLGLVACARVDQAARNLCLERVVQACLIAGDAGVDVLRAIRRRLAYELRVGQQRARHRHHIGAAIGQHALGHFRCVDAVGRDQRNADLALHLLRHPGEGGARHARRDGGDARLVPADAGVDDGGACLLHGLGELHDLFPRAAVGNQVDHREAVDDDEVAADGFTRAAHDLDGQAHAIGVAAAPVVGALVGVGDEELVDEVALGTHDLDAVVTGLAGQLGAAHEGADLALDAAC